MKKYEHISGALRVGEGSYVCSTDEFTQETDKPDGSMLEVIDESSHTVVGYYLAYNGYWNER